METEQQPLVSALMIVNNPNQSELYKCIECFKKQTYANKELIIINNADSQFQASNVNIDFETNVFLVDTPKRLEAGHARNYAISAANGQILAQFDYDSWHDPSRLETQILALAQNQAHVCILTSVFGYSYNSGHARLIENPKKAILNTMVFIRPSNIDYPKVEKYEEFGLLNKMINAGYKVISIEKPKLICKFNYSDKPINVIQRTNLNKKNTKFINSVLRKRLKN